MKTNQEIIADHKADCRNWLDRYLQSAPVYAFSKCSVSAYPACRGGWNSTRFSGRYKINYTWEKGLHSQIGQKGHYAYPNCDKEYRWYCQNVKPLVQMDFAKTRILQLYRKSGLIPKHIAKRHNVKAKTLYGDKCLETKKGQTLIFKWSTRYLLQFAKCPDCSSKGFTENLCGWSCNGCGQTWNDSTYKWEPQI